ncbi:unnamed protein product [Bemisia tabaci]|uniref:Kinase suppressor of ras n=1 Tax=Bemisia tabaci TaxID=7038 RepID=A0A9P0CCJ5_BEMTA|nr:PREDICTED: kinase suppressor of Ras 2 isoform X1 [Bemisia tabaci]CAH0773160.1 unnamed protein product [Bemisia tabaci]
MEFFIFPLCMSESWVDSPNKSDHKSSQLCVMAEEDSDAEIRRSLDVVQSMIDISAERLQGLRTQCATSVELTRQEIRTLEGKLIKLFSRQLVTKTKLKSSNHADLQNIPSLKQWLLVVGLGPESIQLICQRVKTIEALQERSEHDIKTLLASRSTVNQEELRRLMRAMHNLKKYTDLFLRGDSKEIGEVALYWDSWDHQTVFRGSSPLRTRSGRCSVPSEDALLPSTQQLAALNHHSNSVSSLPQSTPTHTVSSTPLSPLLYHPPSTPPLTPSSKGKGDKVKFPTTPPPRKKHQTGLHSAVLLPENHSLIKSKSHESQLGNKIENELNNIAGPENEKGRRGRLPTEPGLGQTSPLLASPIRSPPPVDDDVSQRSSVSLQVPKSPRTPNVSRGMGHVIAHRFTKTFKMMTTCDYCDKQMFIGTGLKCKECKYKCHRDCESKVPPSCGLPREFVDAFRRKLQSDAFVPSPSPNMNRPSPSHHSSNRLMKGGRRSLVNVPLSSTNADSSSNTSSCNSSTPSSPALVIPSQTSTMSSISKQQFRFPEVNSYDSQSLDLKGSLDSDLTISMSTDSDRTPVRVDSLDSQVSDGDASDKAWPRQNSLSMREWDIPWDELKMGEPIGTGHFGTVYRGNWHGDVAIKVLKMDCLDDEKTLEAFKLEVAMFRKTRHENLVLFMGACMKPPRLAIVTSMCKGMTLYTHIHLYKDKFNVNNTTIVAQQISQGMGYLHARGIIHKDLKSKNIFLENGKVVITDFGLFSVTKLCIKHRKEGNISIPPGWLCYLAPEVIRSLNAHHKPEDEDLPFTQASDVYAFGTVWYELLCGEWPFNTLTSESIIWQVGRGMKQPLANLQASQDVKDILMLCWSFNAADRPDFAWLLKTLEKIPRKRLARSPSHPIHLSRSAESVF